MEISRLNETTILITGINPFIAELLRLIVTSADPGDNERARARIYSAPTEDPAEYRFTEDWQEYVEPGLAKLFQSALEIVAGDLKKMHADPVTGDATLFIPSDHLEQWIHGLNQARLVLSERHELNEGAIDPATLPAGDPRTFLLVQMQFYVDLQAYFLRLIDGR